MDASLWQRCESSSTFRIQGRLRCPKIFTKTKTRHLLRFQSFVKTINISSCFIFLYLLYARMFIQGLLSGFKMTYFKENSVANIHYLREITDLFKRIWSSAFTEFEMLKNYSGKGHFCLNAFWGPCHCHLGPKMWQMDEATRHRIPQFD